MYLIDKMELKTILLIAKLALASLFEILLLYIFIHALRFKFKITYCNDYQINI